MQVGLHIRRVQEDLLLLPKIRSVVPLKALVQDMLLICNKDKQGLQSRWLGRFRAGFTVSRGSLSWHPVHVKCHPACAFSSTSSLCPSVSGWFSISSSDRAGAVPARPNAGRLFSYKTRSSLFCEASLDFQEGIDHANLSGKARQSQAKPTQELSLPHVLEVGPRCPCHKQINRSLVL